MLDNFSCFLWSVDFFFQKKNQELLNTNNKSVKCFRSRSGLTKLDPDQDRQNFGLDLDPNILLLLLGTQKNPLNNTVLLRFKLMAKGKKSCFQLPNRP